MVISVGEMAAVVMAEEGSSLLVVKRTSATHEKDKSSTECIRCDAVLHLPQPASASRTSDDGPIHAVKLSRVALALVLVFTAIPLLVRVERQTSV